MTLAEKSVGFARPSALSLWPLPSRWHEARKSGRVSARRNGERYSGKMQRYGFGIAEEQNEPGTLPCSGQIAPKNAGRFRPLVFRRRRPRAAQRLVFLFFWRHLKSAPKPT
ncbi:MAG: hypothetical protein P8Y48_10750, partial [Novosphingobium sp.]